MLIPTRLSTSRTHPLRATCLLIALSVPLFLTGARQTTYDTNSYLEAAGVDASNSSSDQIFNESGSAPVVSHTLVETGLSAGTIDATGNLDADPGFVDPIGVDKFEGTLDDDLSLNLQALPIDKGSNAALPADRFDLDGDGDFDEPFPIDLTGSARIFNGGPASTVDMGAFEYASSNPVGIDDEGKLRDGYTLEAPFPNPSTGSASVKFQVGSYAKASVVVYDLLGREVMSLFDGPAAPGRSYDVHVPTSRLPSGVYILQLSSGRHRSSTQLVIAR